MKRVHLLVIIISLLFIACNSAIESKSMSEYFESKKYDPVFVKKYRIKSRLKTEIQTNYRIPTTIFANGEELSPNKLRSIEYFDEQGLCYLVVSPSYKMIPNDTSYYTDLNALDKFFLSKEIESNEPTGYYDSTFNYFDENKHLIIVEHHKTTLAGVSYLQYTETFSYDKKGNINKKCTESGNSSSFCSYTSYIYYPDGKIKTRSDSFSVDIRRPDRPSKGITQNYTYDSKGLLKSMNDTRYLYDNRGLLSEEYTLSGKEKIDIIYYSYDQAGNCVREDHVRSVMSSTNPKTFVTTVDRFDTSTALTSYNDKNLITEYSYKHSRSRSGYQLYKYEYVY